MSVLLIGNIARRRPEVLRSLVRVHQKGFNVLARNYSVGKIDLNLFNSKNKLPRYFTKEMRLNL